jgi:hypothetical protein
MKRKSRMGSTALDPVLLSEWALGERRQVRGSIREAVGRLLPEATAKGRISVRDSLVAALLTLQHAGHGGDARFETDRLLESCDLHHDSLDEQPDEYLGLLHDVLCSR